MKWREFLRGLFNTGLGCLVATVVLVLSAATLGLAVRVFEWAVGR